MYSHIGEDTSTLLKEHLEEVGENSKKLIESKSINPDLEKITEIIGYSHDLGKATSYFQEYLRGNGKPSNLKNHSKLSALYCYFLLKEEVENEKSLIPMLGCYVVLRHHTKLKNLEYQSFKDTWEGSEKKILEKQLEDLSKRKAEIKELYENWRIDHKFEQFLTKSKSGELFEKLEKDSFLLMENQENIKNYLKSLLLYSILLNADKFSAGRIDFPERKKLPKSEIVDKYIRERIDPEENEMNNLRAEAKNKSFSEIKQKNLDDKIFSLNLPTGLGKTLTSVKIALHLRKKIEREKGFKPRIIYSLPFLSIIEQNYDEIEKLMSFSSVEPDSKILLKHHYLSEGHSKDKEKSSIKDLLLTESWHSEIVVTTFVQLFETLLTNRKNKAMKFHNITNSVIILDEIQSIPRKYWKVIRKILRNLSDYYNCWIVLMTATQPLIFEPDDIDEVPKNRSKYFGKLDRVKYSINTKINKIDSLRSEIKQRFQDSDNSIMAVMNTISSAERLFNKLRDGGIPKEKMIFLSTNLTPKDRISKIEDIKKDSKRKVIITTQLIEAGVDIDIDEIFRDLSPYDSIVQTAGRCNRESSREKGKVKIINLKDNRTGKKFHQYIYDNTLIGATKDALGNIGELNEKCFNFKGTKNYYRKLKQRGSDRESDKILEGIRNLRFSETEKFELIEQDYEKISIFIEDNDQAREIREEFEEILEEEYGYEQKAKISSLKKDFYEHIIDLRTKEEAKEKITTLPKVKGTEEIFLVPKDKIGRWYDAETTGFKLPESTFKERFL